MSQVHAAGTVAPEFTLPVTPDQKLSLSDLAGKPIIMVFYPADWSPVCSDQLALYNEVLPEFRRHGAELLGLSVAGVWCHAVYAQHRRLHYPLLADFHPKGEVAKKYGVYRESEGICERALFVIDKNGVIAWSYCSPMAVNPGADGILDALEKLSKEEMSMLRVPVTPADHIRGPENAPVTLVEYGDYECPFCGQAHSIVNRVRKHFGDDVNLVFRHFPMTIVHPHAQSAAETAELAGAHGCFWEMHDGLYANQDSLGLPLYITLATALGLSEQEVLTALETGLYAPKVRRDFMGGVRSGVNGTPTFFINGHRHDGPFEFATLVSAIDSALLEVRKVGAI